VIREGSLEAPQRQPLGWQDEGFYDESKLYRELERIFDICHGCRRCVSGSDSRRSSGAARPDGTPAESPFRVRRTQDATPRHSREACPGESGKRESRSLALNTLD